MTESKTKTAASGKNRARSLSHRQCPPPVAPKNLRSIMPQIIACLAAGTYNISEGLSLSYSSSLIPALQDPKSDIPITLNQGVLLASIMVVSMALGCPLAGIVMNRFGRINTIRLSALPFSLGWFLVATANSYEQILLGRVLTGLSNAFGVSSAVVFTTEVAAPHIRGALNGANPTLASAGIVGAYVLGAVTDWRTTAWICGTSSVITLVLTFLFSYESPIWLVSRGRLEDAGKSLRAYARYNETEELREELPKRQLAWLIQRRSFTEAENQKKKPWYYATVDLFRTPVGYKPLLILTAIFVAQNFSGVYITLFYAAPFFEEMGVQVDKFEAAIFIGLARLFVGAFAVGLIRKIGIRILMMGSSFGMAVCMVLSGYFTLYPEKGLGGWVAVSMILVYVAFSCCGLLTVPWTMTAEMYPDHLRDVGQAVTLLIANMLMFAGLQLYPVLRSVLQYGEITGAVGMQWFFAVVALLNVILVIFFLPETHGKTLQEIEEHYQFNTLWLGRKKNPLDDMASGTVIAPTLSVGVDLATVEKGGFPFKSSLILTPDSLQSPDIRKTSSDSIHVSVGDSYRL